MLKDWIEVQFTALDFTVTELWRNEFTKFLFLVSDGSVLDTSPTPPLTRGCDILHETSIEIPRSAVTVASPIGNGKKKTPSTTTVSHKQEKPPLGGRTELQTQQGLRSEPWVKTNKQTNKS